MINPQFVPVMSNGLGVESAAILLRWINEPDSRDFALKDLIVITAMTGREWPDTIQKFEQHMLPLFRKHGIRFVQVARAGHLEEEGIIVLNDSRAPSKVFAEGAYTLTQELLSAGTVPQFGGEHRCSLKFKAFAIETWLKQNVERSVRHTFGYNCQEMSRVLDSEKAIGARVTFGFNSGELGRVAGAQEYDRPTRIGHYPLPEWGWDRAQCVLYIKLMLGVDWDKSACPYCPFAQVTAAFLERQKRFPEETALAMFLERISLAMNPRGQLFKKQPLYVVVEKSGNVAAFQAFDRLMEQHRWALYRVRRIYQAKPIYDGIGKKRKLIGHDPSKKGTARRCVQKIQEFATCQDAQQPITELAQQRGVALRESHGLHFLVIGECGTSYPTSEEFFVCAPAVVDTKARYGIEHFDSKWQGLANMYCGTDDLALWDAIEPENRLIQIG
jgi:hypothetical protein